MLFKVNIIFVYFNLLNIGNKKVMGIVIHIESGFMSEIICSARLLPTFIKESLKIFATSNESQTFLLSIKKSVYILVLTSNVFL